MTALHTTSTHAYGYQAYASIHQLTDITLASMVIRQPHCAADFFSDTYI